MQLAPLFPNRFGTASSKYNFVEMINVAVSQSGLPIASLDGTPLFGGQSLRRTGIRDLARARISKPGIVAISRHLSAAYEQYLDKCYAESATEVGDALGKHFKSLEKVVPYDDASFEDESEWWHPESRGADKFVHDKDPMSMLYHVVVDREATVAPCGYSVYPNNRPPP